MSLAVFYGNKINWKLWAIACLVTSGVLAYSACLSHEKEDRVFSRLTSRGLSGESRGEYRLARQSFDLALLKARSRQDKDELLEALLNSARLDSLFGERELPYALAKEAFELSSRSHGPLDERTIKALRLMAFLEENPEDALVLCRKALHACRIKYGNRDIHVGEVLLDLSTLYFDLGQGGAALSACKASKSIFESTGVENHKAYPESLLQYAFLADIDNTERCTLLKRALTIQEKRLGKEHPELVLTLESLAAAESNPSSKVALAARAAAIDEKVFGALSLQYGSDLISLADAEENAGLEKESVKHRVLAAQIFRGRKEQLEAMSFEFLESYAGLLHKLKFEAEAVRIDALVTMKKLSEAELREKQDSDYDMASDPEYWQRTELLPIAGVESFSAPDYDHLQVWYEKGTLRLETFFQGDIVFQKKFAQCESGILKLSGEKDGFTVSWRDGEGPLWHHDRYKISSGKVSRVSSSLSDAYAEDLNRQVEAVLQGDDDALYYGAIENVPAGYLNNNFIADSIRKAERRSIQLYGMGDPAAAAENLAVMFELMSRAVNTKRFELKHTLSREEAWLDAFEFQRLPLSDYITALNDYGFFLQQSSCTRESAEVLALVTRLAPERAVAQLNLADSLWSLGNLKEARLGYEHYLKLQSLHAGTMSIPSRVYQRLGISAPLLSSPLRASVLGV